jgi:hypothetical protein
MIPIEEEEGWAAAGQNKRKWVEEGKRTFLQYLYLGKTLVPQHECNR